MNGHDDGEPWRPRFEGQRPPFSPGNTVSVRHGVHSARTVAPVARRIVDDLLADPNTPAYLRENSYRMALDAWGNAQARCELLRAYIDKLSVVEAVTDTTESEEDERSNEAGTRRRKASVTRRINAAEEQLRRAETGAAAMRRDLGLTPLSRWRLGRDFAQAKRFDLATIMAEIYEEEKAAKAQAERADTAEGEAP